VGVFVWARDPCRLSAKNRSESLAGPRFGGARSLLPFLFFFTLVTGRRRSFSLKLSDTRVYAPQIRALLGTASHFCEVVASSHSKLAFPGLRLVLPPWNLLVQELLRAPGEHASACRGTSLIRNTAYRGTSLIRKRHPPGTIIQP